MGDVLLKMEGIDKTFPGVHALDHAQFELRAGEVHALVGENGAGKSTLMKILAGIYAKDAGSILYRGQEANISSPRSAQHLGISMIHQELNLMPHLTLAQNVFVGRDGRPVLLDFATSSIAMGKVRVAYNKGEKLGRGILIDSTGRPTVEPGVMFNEPIGALLPFGEHKGYGLSLIHI